MEKLFSFNKFFVFFCAVFVFEWFALQIVGHLRLTNLAKVDGERILAWHWNGKNLRSDIQICDTKILKHDANDAVVKVSAKQSIRPIYFSGRNLLANHDNATDPHADNILTTKPESTSFSPKTVESPTMTKAQIKENIQCGVTLTYYRMNSQWLLGKVECQ